MTEQLQLRRGTAAQVVAFTGAQGEIVVDTTNNRAVVNDGATMGGWPAAKLAEVVTNTRTAVNDAAYTALISDRSIAYTALTAARVVTLPAASAYPAGTALTVFDESGACSATKTITLAPAGSDTIDGAASAVISSAYGFLALQSNGAGKWTIVDQATSNLGPVGIGTAADPSNPLSVYGAAALFNGTNFNVTVNKAAAGDTASLIFEDGFSGRAQMGLAGSDNFSFKVSPNGSTWTTAIALDAATGAATFANQRTAVSDAAYSALTTDRLIAYTAITAARVVSLPTASSYGLGQRLTVVDESGACSATNSITLARAGSDTINGAAGAIIAAGYGYIELESNGSNAWTIIDTAALLTGDSGSGGAQGLAPAPPARAAAYDQVLGASGSWVGQMAGFRNRIINGGQAIDQRNSGASQTITAGAALAYTTDRFYAYCTGANVTGQRTAGSPPDQFLYQFTGAASVTAIGFGQRIETANSFDLAGTTATLSVKLANSLLTAVAWAAYYATTADTFGTLASPTKTLIASGSCTVNSTLTEYSAQIAIPSAATTGIEVVLSVGAQTSGTWRIGEVQFESGLVATPFERRPIGVELTLCQRYFYQLTGNASSSSFLCLCLADSATQIFGGISFPVIMRAAPALSSSGLTALLIGGLTGAVTSISYGDINPGGCFLNAMCSGGGFTAGNASMFFLASSTSDFFSASAEL